MAAPKRRSKKQRLQQTNQRLVRVTISLEPGDYAAFKRLGEPARLSRSWLIRKAMREFLDKNRDSNSIGILLHDRS